MKITMLKRMMSLLLCLCMVLSYVPATVFAAEADGLCGHHETHTDECGYAPAVEGSDCTHECGDDCAEGCIHIEHDEGCGYQEAVAEQSCAFAEGCDTCAEEEAAKKAAEEEAARKAAEEEAARKAAEEEAAKASAEAVESVRALIEALPSVEELEAMSWEEKQAAYSDTQAADEAYQALTDAQKAELAEENAKLDELFGYFNTLTEPTETYAGSCGSFSTWSFDSETGTLTISGQYQINDYDEIETPWYKAGLDPLIKTVVIEEGITIIGAYAFDAVENLETVYLPKSLTTIDTGAFRINRDGDPVIKDVYYAGTEELWDTISISQTYSENVCLLNAKAFHYAYLCADGHGGWVDGVCATCGVACEHNYSEGICTNCSNICIHPDKDADGVCPDCGFAPVAKVTVGEEYWYASSLADAMETVPNDGKQATLTLLSDATEAFTVKDGMDVVFEGGEHSLTVSSGHAITVNAGKLEVVSGTVKATAYNGYGIFNATTGTVTLKGTAKVEASGASAYGLYNNGGGTMNVEGGSVTSGYYGIENYATTGTVNISGGSVTGNTYGINNNGTLNITGGSVTGTTSHGIYNKGGIQITGGSVTGAGDGINVQGSNSKVIKITGGTITGGRGYYALNNPSACNMISLGGGIYLGGLSTKNTNFTLSFLLASGCKYYYYENGAAASAYAGNTYIVTGDLTVVCSHSTWTDGVCDTCDEECQHDAYTDGVCDTCGLACQHSYENGFCTLCGGYESAVDSDSDGYYEIDNAGKLYWFAAVVNGGYGDTAPNAAANAILTDNITVNTGTVTASSTTARKWTPILAYTGKFDGNEKTVSGLYITAAGNEVGLFGSTNDATIENVGVINSYFKGSQYVGAIVGNGTGGSLTGCYSTSTVSGELNVGGLAGYFSGTVTNCYNTAGVSGKRNVGGLVGNGTGSTVTGCYNSGDVDCQHLNLYSYAGGIVGHNYTTSNAGSISKSWNTGKVSGTGEGVGGIAGYVNVSIEDCYNAGEVTGVNFTGGIVGKIYGSSKTVKYCHNYGTVTSTKYGGAIAGQNSSVSYSSVYYLEGTASLDLGTGTETIATSFTAEQFASGVVCNLLDKNYSGSRGVWKQNLKSDAYPVLTGSTVYAVENCKGETVYSNTNENIGHIMQNGACAVCGQTPVAAVTVGDTTTQYLTMAEAMAAVPTDGSTKATVTLLANVTTGITVTEGMNVVFEGGAYSLTVSSGNAITMTGGELEVASGTVETSYSIGRAISGQYNGNGSLTVSGNAVVKASGASGIAIYFGFAGDVTVKDNAAVIGARHGIYGYHDGSTLTVSGGTVTGETYGIYNYHVDVTVSGGEVYGISNYYGDVTVSGGEVKATSETASGIFNGDNGSVTVSGGKITGGVYGVNNDSQYGTVTVSGGTLTGTEYALYNNNGSQQIFLSGGVYLGGIYASSGGVDMPSVADLLSEGYQYVSYDSISGTMGEKLDLSGKVQYANNIAVVCAHILPDAGNTPATCKELAHCGLCGQDYGDYADHEINKETGYCKYGCDLYMAKATVTANETTGYYTSLTAAMAAVPTDGTTAATVTLLDNSTECITVTDGMDVILVGEDFSIAPSGGHPITVTGGKVEVVSGTISTESLNGYPIYATGGEIILSGTTKVTAAGTYANLIYGANSKVTVTGQAELSGKRGIIVSGYSTVTVTGGSVTATGSSTSGIDASGNSTVTVSGGKVSGTYYGIVNGAGGAIVSGGEVIGGTDGILNSGTVTIDGGTVTGQGYGINSMGASLTTVNDGTVEGGNYGIYCIGTSSVEITGGTVTGGSYAVRNNGSGSITVTGGAVTSTEGGGIYNIGTGAITISGGTITGTGTGTSMYALYNDSEAPGVSLSGGIFVGGIYAANGNSEEDATVADLLATGYQYRFYYPDTGIVGGAFNGASKYYTTENLIVTCDHTRTHPDNTSATCQTLAYCGSCKQSYGNVASHIIDNATGYCIYGCGNYLAKVTVTVGATTTYYTRATEAFASEAISNMTSGETAAVRLLDSISENASLQAPANNIVLDLNGQTLWVWNVAVDGTGVNLTVKDSTDGAAGVLQTLHNVRVHSGGTLTLESGKIHAQMTNTFYGGINVVSGTLNITGGTLMSGEHGVYVVDSDSVVNISGGIIQDSGADDKYALYNYGAAPGISLSGGIFMGGVYASAGSGEGPLVISDLLADGKKYAKYDVAGGIGADFPNAGNCCHTGDDLTVVCAHTLSHDDNVSATCQAPAYCGTCGQSYGEKADHEINHETGYCKYGCGLYMAKVLVKDHMRDNEQWYYADIDSANEFELSSDYSTLYMTLLDDVTAVGVTGGIFYFAGESIQLDLNGHTLTVPYLQYANGAKVKIIDTSETKTGTIAVTGNHSIASGAEMTLESGILDHSVWVRGTMTVDGGTVNNAITVQGSGSLTVNDGTITPASGYGIIADSATAQITVTGGTIAGGTSGYALYNSGNSNKISLSGGVFINGIWSCDNTIAESDPEFCLKDLLADGYGYAEYDAANSSVGETYDGSGYQVLRDLAVVCAHKNLTYSRSETGETVFALCRNDRCHLAGQPLGTIKLVAEDAVYDGEPHGVTVETTGILKDTSTRLSYQNLDTEEYLSNVPSEVGRYGVDCFSDALRTPYVEYEITPAVPEYGWTQTQQTTTYNGTPATVTPPVATKLEGSDTFGGTFTYAYAGTTAEGQAVSGEGLPTNAGVYTVTASAEAWGNYAAADVTGTMTLTINKKAADAVTFPTASAITYGQTLEESILTGGNGNGTFAWADKTAIPSVGGSVDVVFTPADTANYDYSGMTGWNEETRTVIQAISVPVNQAVPGLGTVTAAAVKDTTDISKVKLTRSNTAVAGTLTLNAGQTLKLGENTLAYTFTPSSGNYKVVGGTVTVNVVDTIAPAGTVTLAENTWNKFLSKITFGLFFNKTQTVTATAADSFSGVASIEYYTTSKVLDLAGVKALTDSQWTTMKNGKVNVTAKDAKQFIYYIRITDKSGNVAYLATNGAEFDTTAPAITGVEDGETYTETREVTVTDKNLKNVTLNGAAVTGTITLTCDVDMEKEYTVVATDKAGNTTTVKVTMAAVCDGGETCPSAPYKDVYTSLWYHEAIDYVIENGLMQGHPGKVFGPEETLTRAQMVQILYNLEGKPAVSGQDSYTDTNPTEWYADPVLWATQKGIVEGYGGGKFGPSDPLTREQMVTILYRYSQYKGHDLPTGSYSSFPDAGKVSDYAKTPMAWAIGKGIIIGMSDGTLCPGCKSTRAQVATVLMRYVEMFK